MLSCVLSLSHLVIHAGYVSCLASMSRPCSSVCKHTPLYPTFLTRTYVILTADALRENQRVTLSGFGTWNVSERREREGRNPRTGEPIKINAKKAVRFKSGKQLESILNT